MLSPNLSFMKQCLIKDLIFPKCEHLFSSPLWILGPSWPNSVNSLHLAHRQEPANNFQLLGDFYCKIIVYWITLSSFIFLRIYYFVRASWSFNVVRCYYQNDGNLDLKQFLLRPFTLHIKLKIYPLLFKNISFPSCPLVWRWLNISIWSAS